MLTCFIEGMKRATIKAVNNDKIKEMTQTQKKILIFSCHTFQRLYAFSPI